MSRPPSSSPKKALKIDPAIVRAVMRARLDAEDRGEPFPETLSEAVEVALKEWLQIHCPEALIPSQGRPRKTSRKPPAKP